MQLGAFSVSLAVQDIARSQDFYQKLGFEVVGGVEEQNWLILRNPTGHTIGLFQGMFEQNVLTFNPGWNQQAEPLDEFTDVRDLQKELRKRGIEFHTEADEQGSGPASFSLLDPDGNPVLVDQHR